MHLGATPVQLSTVLSCLVRDVPQESTACATFLARVHEMAVCSRWRTRMSASLALAHLFVHGSLPAAVVTNDLTGLLALRELEVKALLRKGEPLLACSPAVSFAELRVR